MKTAKKIISLVSREIYQWALKEAYSGKVTRSERYNHNRLHFESVLFQNLTDIILVKSLVKDSRNKHFFIHENVFNQHIYYLKLITLKKVFYLVIYNEYFIFT